MFSTRGNSIKEPMGWMVLINLLAARRIIGSRVAQVLISYGAGLAMTRS